ncbi:MAG: Rne/Rng family ribonuclease [Prevotellaceae bacterium]|jgi:ribonuclease G|nr:Rne/Rng family ribonuclease [Prevotellaceae bacterium]
MNKELVIDVRAEQVSIALLEDKKLVEFSRDNLTENFDVGNIYLGRVKRIMAGLNAAFIDIGCDKEAFIHYHDLGENFPSLNNYVQQILSDRKHQPKFQKLPQLAKDGSIKDVLTVGQMILVQITKEPISTKGARISGEISIAGRFMVMLPFADNRTTASQKIESHEEKTRLRQLVHSIKPQNFSVIIRTVAEGKRVAELDNEMKMLNSRWEKTVESIRKSKDVTLLSQESSRTVAILRELFSPDFESIYINDEKTFEEIKNYIALISPDQKDIVKYYKDEIPIYDHFGITRQIKIFFGRIVPFKRGAYLILDQTEAMFVIDVNSGTRTKASQNQEINALEVNLAAAEEIARQLRLRDIGGIVVVDFIDMENRDNLRMLYERMQLLMKDDRARHNILPLSKFCVMEMTRQRVRPAIAINTSETCPTCFGTGKAKPSIFFTNQLEEKIEQIVKVLKIKKFSICIHPFVAAFIEKGFFSQKRKWRRKYTRKLKVVPMQELGFLQYKFLDSNKEEIDLNLLKEVEKK